MRSVKNLIEYIPPFLKDVREYNRIFVAEDIELRELDENLKSLITEVIVKTAKSYGLDRYEKIYNIKNTSNNVGARRATILTRMNSRVPFTYKWLYYQLLENFGENGFEINLDYNNYSLEIVIYGLHSEVADIFIQNLYEKLPANLTQIFKLIIKNSYNIGATIVQKEIDTLIVDTSIINEKQNINNEMNVGSVITQIETDKLIVDTSIIRQTIDISQSYNLGGVIIQKENEKLNIDNTIIEDKTTIIENHEIGGIIVQKENETLSINNSIINEKLSIKNENYIATNLVQKENIKLKEEK